jgi:hypothetical protein
MRFLPRVTPQKLIATGLTAAVSGAFFLLVAGSAEAVSTGLKSTADVAGLSNVGTNVYTTVGRVLNVALGLVGVLFLVLIIYAGFLWMTAQGSVDQVKKAKTMMVQAVIGLVIILASYAITDYVIFELLRATTGTTTPPAQPTGGG